MTGPEIGTDITGWRWDRRVRVVVNRGLRRGGTARPPLEGLLPGRTHRSRAYQRSHLLGVARAPIRRGLRGALRLRRPVGSVPRAARGPFGPGRGARSGERPDRLPRPGRGIRAEEAT